LQKEKQIAIYKEIVRKTLKVVTQTYAQLCYWLGKILSRVLENIIRKFLGSCLNLASGPRFMDSLKECCVTCEIFATFLKCVKNNNLPVYNNDNNHISIVLLGHSIIGSGGRSCSGVC